MERLQWILHYTQHGSVSDTCTRFGISRSTFYRWLKRFDPLDYSKLTDHPTRAETGILSLQCEAPFSSFAHNLYPVESGQGGEVKSKENERTCCPFCRFSQWFKFPRLRTIGTLALLVVILNLTLLFLVLPVTAGAAGTSSWNPTLLVNTEAFQTIDDVDTGANVKLKFGETLQETLTYNRSAARFEFSRSIHVGGSITATGSLSIKGAMSGSSLHVDNAVDVNGDISGSGTLRIEGAAAFGSTIKLNGVTYTFPYGDGSASGKVLKTNGAGQLVWSSDLGGTGLAVSDGDARYVKKSGDTMTGALSIRPLTAGEAALEVAGTASGRILSFGQRLTGSGAVSIRTLTDSTTAFQVMDSDGGNPVFNIDTTNERVGIGTAAPETALEVVGTMSGSSLQVTGTGASPLIYTNVSNGRVGIGTNSPSQMLEINEGNVKISGMGRALFTNDTLYQDDGIYFSGNGTINKLTDELRFGWSAITSQSFYTSGAERVRVDANGNVGIGTTAPNVKLSVAGTASGRILSFGQRLTGSGAVSIRTLTDSTTAFQVMDSDGGNPVFNIDTTNERVGIGMNNPQFTLDVAGTAQVGSATSGLLYIVDRDTAKTEANFQSKLGLIDSQGSIAGQFGFDSGSIDDLVIDSVITGKGIQFQTQSATKMTLDSNGQLGIGTSTPETKLEIVGTASGDVLHAQKNLSSSGTLAIEGNSAFGGTLKLNDVNYTFPYGDGSASGKVLKTNGAGQLVWSADQGGSGLAVSDGDARYVKKAGDTMTGALLIKKNAGTATGNTLVVDTTGLVYDATNKRVGINTPYPNAPLNVVSTSAADQEKVQQWGYTYASNDDTGYNLKLKQVVTSGVVRWSFDQVNSGTAYSNVLSLDRGNVGMGIVTPETKLEVAGTMSGRLLQITGTGANPLIKTVGGNIGIGTAAPETKLEIVGTMSGDLLHAQKDLSSSGTLAIEGNSAFGGTLKLNGVNYTFPFGDGTASGKVLKTNGAGQLVWSADQGGSGLAMSDGDARYVKKAGDTMTGALSIRPLTAGEAALEVAGTASGRILSFGQRLTGSGNVSIRSGTDSTTAVQVLDNDGGNPVFNIDTTNERVGIGTATPGGVFDVQTPGDGALQSEYPVRPYTIGTPSVNSIDANWGYSFTPAVNGQVTQLWLRVNDTSSHTVRLYDESNGSVLGSVAITGNGSTNWVSGDISPVSVTALSNYIVAVRTTNYAYESFVTPVVKGNVTINGSRYSMGTNDMPTNVDNSWTYGEADITFATTGVGVPVTRLTVTSEGNVGVGTATPETKLEIAGTASGDVLHAQKGLSSSGTLAIEGNSAFGGTLKLNGVNYTFPFGDGTASGKVLKTNGAGQLVWSADQGGSGLAVSDGDARYVRKSGDTMTGALSIRPLTAGEAALEVAGTASGRILSFGQRLTGSGNVSIRSGTDSTTAVQVLDNDGGNPVLNIDTTNERVGIGTAAPVQKLEVSGVGSAGIALTNTDGYGGSSDIEFYGLNNLSAIRRFATIKGLVEGEDVVNGDIGAITFSTKDGVGDTALTERMRINYRGNVGIGTIAPNVKLSVAGTASGRILSFGDRLTGSGAVSIRTLTDSTTAFQVMDNDGGNPVFNIDTTNERVGIGTAAPETSLEVVGTLSGSVLQGKNINGSASAASGSIMIGQAGVAPIWKAPTGSMVWFIDGNVAIAQNQGAAITMPYGLTASSVNLRAKGAPTGADLIVDIQKNGTTIFSTKPQIAASATTGGGAASFSVTDLSAGSIITVDVTQVGSTFSGSGLTIQLNGTRKY